MSAEANKVLVKSAGVVGLMTLTSRILGMIRDIVSAMQFGTSWHWDAFLYAFMLPNFLRRIVGEGALSSAFIPVYTNILEKEGKAEAFRFANIIATFLGTGLLLFLFFIEVIIYFVLNSAWIHSERLRLSLELLLYLSPYLWFISILAVAMGILNSHRHFFSPALGPIILDIFWIAGILVKPDFVSDIPRDRLHWLALIVLISGVVQLICQVAPLYQLGFRLHLIWDYLHEGARKTGRLILPALLGFAIVQINLFVDSTLGMFIGEGANSSLWYGSRLMQFPLGIFAVSMGTALLPMISRQSAAGDLEGARQSISFSLRNLFLIILPCSIGLIVLREPIIQLLFERGAFDAVSTERSSRVLLFYSLGLIAFSGQKILASGFYAVQDSKTPVKLGAIALLVNIVFNLCFMTRLKEAGLAFATSLSGWIQFVLLCVQYHQKVGVLPIKQIRISFLKILIASILMGAVASMLFEFLQKQIAGDGLSAQIAEVGVSILIASLSYILFCLILRVREMQEAWKFLWRRKNGPRNASKQA